MKISGSPPSLAILLAVGASLLSSCQALFKGKSSFETVTPPPSARSQSAEQAVDDSDIRVVSIPARPLGHLPTPVYPKAALDARVGKYVIFVQVVVGESGRVSDVTPSLGRVALPSPHAEAFLESVRETVLQWRLSPARMVYWQKVPGQDDRYLRTEAVAESMELKFTFEADGKVR
ncbi:MAG: hypothetical protein U1F61_14640 [Opitutaceae bacterium]